MQGERLRILFLGERWFGSCARACHESLRRLEHEVIDIDSQTFSPPWRKLWLKGIKRLLHKQIVREYNNQVLSLAQAFEPDLLFAFKAPYLTADTLRTLHKRGIPSYNYYPDTAPWLEGEMLMLALAEYDCIFSTKPFLEEELRQRIPIRRCAFVRHGYDPVVHHPVEMNAWDKDKHDADIVFVGTWAPSKERWLSGMIRGLNTGVKLKIWGNGWERCSDSLLAKHIMGTSVEGTAYPKAITGGRIALGLLLGPREPGAHGDETTTRTYEIPACGGFMLHERTPEVLKLFEEGREIACFGDVDELIQKVRHYLKHNAERKEMTRAGYERCVPAYSYDERMKECIEWHYRLTRP